MRYGTLLKLGAAVLLPAVLAACGSDNPNNVAPPPPPAQGPTSFQSQFGANFAGAFDADGNAEPIDPSAGDVPALDPDGDPLDN